MKAYLCDDRFEKVFIPDVEFPKVRALSQGQTVNEEGTENKYAVYVCTLVK